MTQGVVADTSEWIEFLAGRPAFVFRQCVEAGTIVVPPIVVTELTGGAKTREERMVLEDMLQDLPLHSSDFFFAARAGELRSALRAKGVTATAADALIAQCAIDRSAPLLTRDAMFWKIAAHTKLRIASGLS